MAEKYNQDQVNFIRLKVNRINFIQSIKVNDDLLSDLINNKIILDEEASLIMSAVTREEKSKSLLECLLHKKCDKMRKDWYIQFRSILIKYNYNNLVTFLDNTIIQTPKFVEKFSSMSIRCKNELKSNSEVILESDSEQSLAKSTSRKDYNDFFKNFNSNLTKPETFLDNLKNSKDPNDLNQFELELDVFEFFKELEQLYTLFKTKNDLYKDSFILDTAICRNILNLSTSFMCVKYFRIFLKKFDIDLLKFFADLLKEYFRQEKIIRLTYYDSLDELVYKLVWTFIRNERNDLANEVLNEHLTYLDYLDSYLNRINIENNNVNNKDENRKSRSSIYNSRDLITASRFYTLSNLIIVKNNLYEFEASFELFKQAIDLLDVCQINGQKVVTTIFYYAIGCTYLELGDFDKSQEYLNKSLLTLSYEDDLLIEILGTTSLCYSSKWLIEKAENLLMLAIQSAKTIYGPNSSYFVKAILFYSNFSNEYIQDESTIRVCEYLVNLTKKVYGSDSIPVADAYKALSKAYITNKVFKNDIYYEYANRSYKIAQEILSIESPKLIAYQISLVSALQWRSIYSEQIEIKEVNLNDAYTLCMQTLKSCMNIYTEKNILTAKIYRLLGSILYYLEKDSESERIHKKSLEILENLISVKDLHYLLTKSTLGVFYKMIGNMNEAIAVLLDVANNIKIERIKHLIPYCKWIPSVFVNLSECYKNKKSDDLANYYNKQAESLKAVSTSIHHKNHDIINIEMNRVPTSNLAKYMNEFINKD